jgi:S-adenosylmethionine synthetase
METIRTAECVTPGHPDKICDIISDTILDACLEQDPNSRVAVETMGGHGKVFVTGEITTNADIGPLKYLVKNVCGIDNVTTNIVKQSNEIANGVDTGGAGDQGIMVGYACNENEALIPHELYLARKLAKYIYSKHPYDGKTQVTLVDGIVDTIVASFQNVSTEELNDLVITWLGYQPNNLYCNPAGDWNQGGFDADAGVTGRKLVVDNYGPRVPIGGGAFSGKDATKVDRSGAYMARFIAVDQLYKHKAEEVYVYLAYAIGKSEPVQATAVVDGIEINVTDQYNLTPNGISNLLELKTPKFNKTAKWGAFGNKFCWDDNPFIKEWNTMEYKYQVNGNVV